MSRKVENQMVIARGKFKEIWRKKLKKEKKKKAFAKQKPRANLQTHNTSYYINYIFKLAKRKAYNNCCAILSNIK